jgi:hypothetical protein
MARPLSEQLADLSVRAKNTENAVAAAEKEAQDKIEARKEQARAAAAKATEKVKQEIKSVGDTAERNWTAVRAKIAADIDALKTGVAQAKHGLDVRQAESHAERLEWEAGVAVDYAIASVEQAKLAVLDAVSSRVDAEKAKAS